MRWTKTARKGGLRYSGTKIGHYSCSKRRRIVEETLKAGASVAWVAFQHAVNSKQVYQWKRQLLDYKLGTAPARAMKVLPVSMMAELERPSSEPSADVPTRCGEIHTELPEEIRIRPKGSGVQTLSVRR